MNDQILCASDVLVIPAAAALVLMRFEPLTCAVDQVKEWPSVNPFMSNNEVWFTVKLAFRMWSEVLPRTFVEDNTSPVNQVDILVGFGNRMYTEHK